MKLPQNLAHDTARDRAAAGRQKLRGLRLQPFRPRVTPKRAVRRRVLSDEEVKTLAAEIRAEAAVRAERLKAASVAPTVSTARRLPAPPREPFRVPPPRPEHFVYQGRTR